MAKGQIYPKNLYLIMGNDGYAHWYKEDPKNLKNRDEAEIDLAEVLFGFYGSGSAMNPLMVSLNCALLDRCEQFNTARLTEIRNRTVRKHIEDGCGNRVDIEPINSGDIDYPLSGSVYDENHQLLARRLYTPTGECSDNNREHDLWVYRDPRPKNSLTEEQLHRMHQSVSGEGDEEEDVRKNGIGIH